jgi:protein-S-isoprenylcysteine O-methyltransferase Ste14
MRGFAKTALLWLDVAATLLLVAFAFRYGPRTVYFYAGLCLTALAMPLWIAARLQLGGSFSVTAQARQLVTTGLYSRFRNPIYFFGGLAYLGGLVAVQSWPLLVAWLAMTPIQIVRIRKEERVLAAAFGADYQKYRAKTWF